MRGAPEGPSRRVVITGIGLVTPLGAGREVSWQRLLAGESGARRIEHFKVDDLPCKIACTIPRTDGRAGGSRGQPGVLDPDSIMSAREQRRSDEFILYALAAAAEAFADCGWVPRTEEDRARAGVLVGSGIGGLNSIAQTALQLESEGMRRVSPFFIPGALINLASGQISIRYGLKGPNQAVATACATGAHAIGEAASLIKDGCADVMLAGGTEGAVCRIGIAGFAALRALSTNFNETPRQASRPYDRHRDGFVMGEGSGLLVLEELQHAKARGARIYAELKGYGISADAAHMTAPDPNAEGAWRSMCSALRNSGFTPQDVDYLNSHGTSTPLGDESELRAIEKVFGADARHLSISSTKSAIGHLLGAAGAVELIFCILAIRDGMVPPTLNLDDPSVNTTLELTPHSAQQRPVRVALSNSFGFGGTNVSLLVTGV